jgi:chloramphenicol O-acetyltransferase
MGRIIQGGFGQTLGGNFANWRWENKSILSIVVRYVCTSVYFIAYQLSLISIAVELLKQKVDFFSVQLYVHTCSTIQFKTGTNHFSYHIFKSKNLYYNSVTITTSSCYFIAIAPSSSSSSS